jgi:hypothetical protein
VPRIGAAVLEELGSPLVVCDEAFELMERQDGIRSVVQLS